LRFGRLPRRDITLTMASDNPIAAGNRRYNGDGEAAR
jgi:hypothetical protein